MGEFLDGFITGGMLIMAIIFLAGAILEYNNNLQVSFKVSEKEVQDYQECVNLSLEDTAYCLRDYVSTFFNYTSREDIEKTLEDIKQNGGDCYDYSMLYKRVGESLGFYSYKFVVDADKDNAHAFAVISDDTGYCLLDQINKPDCTFYEIENEKENI